MPVGFLLVTALDVKQTAVAKTKDEGDCILAGVVQFGLKAPTLYTCIPAFLCASPVVEIRGL